MAKSFRNVVAGDSMGRHKAKRIVNDRGNRRANDTRNTKAFMSEMDDIDNDNNGEKDSTNYFEALYG